MNWSHIFFKLGRYVHLDKYQIWDLTLPQLNYYLKECDVYIDFTVKVSTMGMASLFGGEDALDNENVVEKREGGEYMKGYKVATEDDMQWLAQVLGG